MLNFVTDDDACEVYACLLELVSYKYIYTYIYLSMIQLIYISWFQLKVNQEDQINN